MQLVNPSATKVMKGITTTFAPVPFPGDSVYFIPSTFNAETTVVFPTCFNKEQPGPMLAPEQGFKAV
jgi:hypothetical protein